MPEGPAGEEQLNARIEALESRMSREDAIARLNDGRAGTEERAAFGESLAELAHLRQEIARIRFAELEAALSAYSGEHGRRVAKYTSKD